MTPAAYRDAAREGGRAREVRLSDAGFRQPDRRDADRAARERVLDLADELDIAVIEDAAYQCAAL